MPYCSRCGVEVDEGVEVCPLCGTPIQQLENEKPVTIKKRYPDIPIKEDKKYNRTEKEKRSLAIEIITISLLVPFLLTLFIDLIVNHTVTWSRFSILVLFFVWIITVTPLFIPKKPIFIVLAEVTAVLSFLALLDYFTDWKIEWFINYALPIIIVTILIASLVVFVSLLAKVKGANIAAYILFGIGALIFALEIIIERKITWSLFVLTPTVVIGSLLLYLHFRFTKRMDLKEKIKEKLIL